jgi:hypothetical protein
MSMVETVQRIREPEIAAALAYQAIDLCQAKPGTVPQFLVCKQRLDRLGGACIRSAIPVIDTVATSTPHVICVYKQAWKRVRRSSHSCHNIGTRSN